jgi:hypothetical protein
LIYADLPLDSAMRLLGTHPLLPIGGRRSPGTLAGVVTLADVERAYGIAAAEPQSNTRPALPYT